MLALRILSAVLGCSLLVLACSGPKEASDDDDDDDGGSSGSGGSGATGGSTASGGTGATGGAGGGAPQASCEPCIQASDCATGFCNQVASRDLDLYLDLTPETEGRCTPSGYQSQCNCGIAYVTPDSICFGDCPDGIPMEFCNYMSGAPFTPMAPVTAACAAGEVSLLVEPVCVSWYECVIAAGCAEVTDYDACVSSAWEVLAPETCYAESLSTAFVELCTTASRDPSVPYPECAL